MAIRPTVRRPTPQPATAPRINSNRLKTALVVVALLGVLTGCSHDIQDLRDYAVQVKDREAPGIKPLPEIKPYQRFEYRDQEDRNPFDSSIFESSVANATQDSDSSLRPDANRNPEFLEGFPLDTLRMVGSMSQNGTLWALVKTPDKTIERVSHGNYMGQHNGRITDISAAGIELTEIVHNEYGGWRKRESTVALSE